MDIKSLRLFLGIIKHRSITKASRHLYIAQPPLYKLTIGKKSQYILDDPALRNRPMMVGAGVVLSASYEARRCGVRTAMPGGRARRLCPSIIEVAPRMHAYAEASRHAGQRSVAGQTSSNTNTSQHDSSSDEEWESF